MIRSRTSSFASRSSGLCSSSIHFACSSSFFLREPMTTLSTSSERWSSLLLSFNLLSLKNSLTYCSLLFIYLFLILRFGKNCNDPIPSIPIFPTRKLQSLNLGQETDASSFQLQKGVFPPPLHSLSLGQGANHNPKLSTILPLRTYHRFKAMSTSKLFFFFFSFLFLFF